MKKIYFVWMIASLLLVRPVLGQADVQALETAIHGKVFGLRTYSADPVARYTWVDGKLVPAYVELHGMNAFFPDTVELKGGKIVIDGQSSTLVRAGQRLAPMGKTPMRLEIDLQGVDAATVVPQLQEGLFFPSMQGALEGLPQSVKDMLPFSSDGVFHSVCHCSNIFQDGKWVKLEENDPKLKPPGFVKMASEAPLNQKAVDEKMSGSLTLIYFISDIGKVDEVWVAKPLGPDLDELAGKIGRDNVFNPAKYDGKSVGSVLVQTIPANMN